MLDVNSGTTLLSGQNAGRPTTQQRADHRAGEAAEAADHGHRDERERVLDAEEPFE